MYGPMNPPAETCAECDREIEIDEPNNCYYTGQTSPCGDCRDPKTNKPPMGRECFAPYLCKECSLELRGGNGFSLLEEGN